MKIYQLNIEHCIYGGDVLFESYAHRSEDGAIKHSESRLNEIKLKCDAIVEDNNIDSVYSRYLTDGMGSYIYLNIVQSELLD
jgi:hypothetical protein